MATAAAAASSGASSAVAEREMVRLRREQLDSMQESGGGAYGSGPEKVTAAFELARLQSAAVLNGDSNVLSAGGIEAFVRTCLSMLVVD